MQYTKLDIGRDEMKSNGPMAHKDTIERLNNEKWDNEILNFVNV